MDYPVQKIAALVLTEGANLSSGSYPLVIEAPAEAKAMADALEEEALRLKPRKILRVTTDPETALVALKDGKGPPPPSAEQKEALNARSGVVSRIRVLAPRPDMLEGIPVEDLIRMHRIMATAESEEMAAFPGKFAVDIVIPYPTKAWATRVYSDLSANNALQSLSHALARSFLLHVDDPRVAWRQRIVFKDRVIAHLKEKNLLRLTLRGSNIDLDLTLEHPGGFCGGTQYVVGPGFQPAFPIGGIFASITPSGTSGYVHINRPLTLAGRRVSGLDLTIRDGLVTVKSALEGGDILGEFLNHSPRTRQLTAVSLPVSEYFPALGDDVFCNPMMDATTAYGLTLTDPATVGALRFDLFFDDDLTIEGTDEDGTVHGLDRLLSSPEALKVRDTERGILGGEDCRVGDLDNKLRDGLTLIGNGRIEDGIAALVETERLAKECFRQFKFSAHDWESKYQQMSRLKIAKAARNAIERAQGDTD